jgi:nucleotide-binding universal stress UspA family protein
MTSTPPPGPVVVGLDGSTAAINAAKWATTEAVHKDVPLRLVVVVGLAPQQSESSKSVEEQDAQTALRAACRAVDATGLPVKIDTAVLWGDVNSILLAESRGASLICVGSVGISRVADRVLGSTAITLAEEAHCPVAVIRSDGNAGEWEGGYVAVVVNDRPGNDEVVGWAMEEARSRRAQVLALTVWRWALFVINYEKTYQRLDHWLREYPDVKVEVAATPANVARYLESFVGVIRLAVIGSEDADHVAQLVGPHGLPILAHADCSVLVVRK